MKGRGLVMSAAQHVLGNEKAIEREVVGGTHVPLRMYELVQ